MSMHRSRAADSSLTAGTGTGLNREIEAATRANTVSISTKRSSRVLDFEEMNMVAAYGGFPNRYPHWKFGMEYERLNKSYAYGLHKIYEMVINNDPCYAYLLECNHLVDQKIVMAHVYGHCDFFKNNIWFSKTNRKMMDTMANHATKVRKYIDKYGLDAVESFIDVCLSIDDLIDHHSVFIERKNEAAGNRRRSVDRQEDRVQRLHGRVHQSARSSSNSRSRSSKKSGRSGGASPKIRRRTSCCS